MGLLNFVVIENYYRAGKPWTNLKWHKKDPSNIPQMRMGKFGGVRAGSARTSRFVTALTNLHPFVP